MPIGPPEVGVPDVNSLWRIDIDTDTTNFNGAWAQLKGTRGTVPRFEQVIKDASDNDTSGVGQDAITGYRWGVNTTIVRKKYVGAYDVAQEVLRAIAEDTTNLNQLVHVRYYERTEGGRAFEGYVIPTWSDKGGPGEDLTEVDINLMGQGERLNIASPYGTAEVPVVSSVSPATGSTAGGDLVTVTGSGFTGATAVTFDGVAAEDFTVVSDSKVAAVTPAGAAGTADVVVTNPTGPSTTGTAVFTYA